MLHINICCRSIKLEITLNGFTYVASHVVLEIEDCKVRNIMSCQLYINLFISLPLSLSSSLPPSLPLSLSFFLSLSLSLPSLSLTHIHNHFILHVSIEHSRCLSQYLLQRINCSYCSLRNWLPHESRPRSGQVSIHR